MEYLLSYENNKLRSFQLMHDSVKSNNGQNLCSKDQRSTHDRSLISVTVKANKEHAMEHVCIKVVAALSQHLLDGELKHAILVLAVVSRTANYFVDVIVAVVALNLTIGEVALHLFQLQLGEAEGLLASLPV